MNSTLLFFVILTAQHPVAGGELGNVPKRVCESDPFSSYAPSQAIRCLREQLSADAEIAIRTAQIAGQPSKAELHRKVGAWSILTTMRGVEADHEVKHVWRMNEPMPADWVVVRNAPCMVDHLTRMGDPLDREIYDLFEAGRKRRMGPFDALRAQCDKEAEGSSKSSQQMYLERLPELKRKLYRQLRDLSSAILDAEPTPEKIELALLIANRTSMERELKQIRARLTPAELAEWNSVVEAYRAKRRIVDLGQNPWRPLTE